MKIPIFLCILEYASALLGAVAMATVLLTNVKKRTEIRYVAMATYGYMALGVFMVLYLMAFFTCWFLGKNGLNDAFLLIYVYLLPLLPVFRIFLPKSSRHRYLLRLPQWRVFFPVVAGGLLICGWALCGSLRLGVAGLFLWLLPEGIGVLYKRAYRRFLSKPQRVGLFVFALSFAGFVTLAPLVWPHPVSFSMALLGMPTLHCLVFIPCLGWLKDMDATERHPMVLADNAAKTSLSTKDAQFGVLLNRLQDLMEKERPHLDPDLRMENLAGRLCTNKTYLSHVLNKMLGVTFFQFVNQYRVRDAQRIFRQNPKLDVAMLCRMCGFHTLSSFTQAFKSIKGMTPGEWLRRQKVQH